MYNFNEHQDQEIVETSSKLAEISSHPAYTFLLHTFTDITEQYKRLDKQNHNATEIPTEVLWIQRSYMFNMLSALNLRLDSILRERSA